MIIIIQSGSFSKQKVKDEKILVYGPIDNMKDNQKNRCFLPDAYLKLLGQYFEKKYSSQQPNDAYP